jgi:hypothetical protein
MAVYIGDLFMRSGGVSYFTPTFPRGGLAGTFLIDILAMHGSSPTLECVVEHKNVEDTSFTTAATFTSMTTTGLKQVQASALKEQIRLNITVGGAVDTNTVYANVLAPNWRPY